VVRCARASTDDRHSGRDDGRATLTVRVSVVSGGFVTCISEAGTFDVLDERDFLTVERTGRLCVGASVKMPGAKLTLGVAANDACGHRALPASRLIYATRSVHDAQSSLPSVKTIRRSRNSLAGRPASRVARTCCMTAGGESPSAQPGSSWPASTPKPCPIAANPSFE